MHPLYSFIFSNVEKRITGILFCGIFCSFLFACNDQSIDPSQANYNNSKQIFSSTPSPTKHLSTSTVSPTIFSTLTPTITLIPPYPTIKPLVNYYRFEGMGGYCDYYEQGNCLLSKLVLYPNGQLIVYSGNKYFQKIMSKSEMDKLLSKFNSLGFFSIESNQAGDDTDKLYNFGDKYEKISDDPFSCINIDGNKKRNLCVKEDYKIFLIPKMQKVLSFVDNYQPKGMVPYIPDRILLMVQAGRNEDDSTLPETTIPLPDTSVSLEKSCSPNYWYKIIYLEGEKAKEVFQLFIDRGMVFSQNGKECTVYMRPVLPHEEVTNIFDQ
jgi:hypothetical protein